MPPSHKTGRKRHPFLVLGGHWKNNLSRAWEQPGEAAGVGILPVCSEMSHRPQTSDLIALLSPVGPREPADSRETWGVLMPLVWKESLLTIF